MRVLKEDLNLGEREDAGEIPSNYRKRVNEALDELLDEAKTSKGRLRKNYADFEDFESYSEMYDLHGRLGYDTPEEAWESNPVIQWSVDPSDFKKLSEREDAGDLQSQVMGLAGALSSRIGGLSYSAMVDIGEYRWSDKNHSVGIPTASTKMAIPLYVVASVFEDGSSALSFFSNSDTSELNRYEVLNSSYQYDGTGYDDINSMIEDIQWSWDRLDATEGMDRDVDYEESKLNERITPEDPKWINPKEVNKQFVALARKWKDTKDKISKLQDMLSDAQEGFDQLDADLLPALEEMEGQKARIDNFFIRLDTKIRKKSIQPSYKYLLNFIQDKLPDMETAAVKFMTDKAIKAGRDLTPGEIITKRVKVERGVVGKLYYAATKFVTGFWDWLTKNDQWLDRANEALETLESGQEIQPLD